MKMILKFLKPYRLWCAITLAVMLLDVVGALFIPTLTAGMINEGVGNRSISVIAEKGALMFLVTVLSGAGTVFGSYLCAVLSAKIGRDMRNALYEKTLGFSDHDFEKFGTGSMIARTQNDVNIVQQAFVWSIQMVLPVPIMCVMGVIMAFSIDKAMGMLLVGITLLVIVCAVFITRKAAVIFGSLQKFLDRINVVLRENITGVRVLRAFNKEQYEEKRMRRSFEDYALSAIKANRLFAGLESLAILVMNLCIVAILWIGGNRIGQGFMKIGDITALTEYAILILFYVIMAQMVIILLPRAKICLERIDAVLSHSPEIYDGSGKMEEVKDTVCAFQNVDFRFEDADEATLGNISFSCKKGETTAIIGSTGSGKSTIAKLLLRFHDIQKGAIVFGGIDIRKIQQKDLRKEIAYVPQKAWLFSGAIADNLRFGNEQATETEMEKALKTAQADFVFSLPQGLNTFVAQGGTNFSGGQRQRLAIARALIRKADLYIFDDSFSALDFQTDAALRKALSKEIQDAAVLIIAQRVNTIVNAHQIIVLEDGKIAGLGTHKELMEQCSIYREIAESQMKGGKTDGQ